MLQLLKICPGVIGCAFGLLILRAKFVIFETDQDLAFADFVSFFDANPFHASRDFGIEIDLVVGNNVSRGGKNYAPNVAGLRRGAHHFYFRHVMREQAVSRRRDAKNYQQRNSDQYVAPRPERGLAIALRLAVNAQALQIFVFGIDRHRFNFVTFSDQPRRALRISLRDACQAGANPPTTPMMRAKIIALRITPEVICKLKTTSLKVT